MIHKAQRLEQEGLLFENKIASSPSNSAMQPNFTLKLIKLHPPISCTLNFSTNPEDITRTYI